ncbi:hypothetical protein KVP09_15505 [Alcaligenaceae bacterium CGII-47]|nr:hypothetical protein [Alcaligenaceae bacterium CGII-47]
MLGDEGHWTDLWPLADAAELARRHRNERLSRVKCLNRVLGAFSCSVTDWQGSQYLLSTFTGKTELVDNLTQLWACVERLSGCQVDPLSVRVRDRLRAS